MIWLHVGFEIALMILCLAAWRAGRRARAAGAAVWKLVCWRIAIRAAWEQVIKLELEVEQLQDAVDAQEALIALQNEALCRARGLDPETWFTLPAAGTAGVRERWETRSYRWN